MSHMWSGLSKQWSLLQPQEVTQEKHSSSCICICICISTGKALLSSREAPDTWRCQEGSDVVDVWTRWALFLTPTLVHVQCTCPRKKYLSETSGPQIDIGQLWIKMVWKGPSGPKLVRWGPIWSKVVQNSHMDLCTWNFRKILFSGTPSLLSTHFSGGGERFGRDGGAHGCFAP